MPDKQRRVYDIGGFDFGNKEKTKIKLDGFEFGNILKRSCLGNKNYKGKIIQNPMTINNNYFIKSEFGDFFKHISDLYDVHVGEQFECSNYYMDTCFNQIQINSSVRSAVHKDTKNVGFSAMVKYSSNSRKYEKATEESKDLFLHDYNLRIELDRNDLLFFDSNTIAHSNPPIQLISGEKFKTHPNTDIISLVFFKAKSLLIK